MSLGYQQFVFFDKFGNFSQIHCNINDYELDTLAELCLRNNYNDDWHYDVIAFPAVTKIDPITLAELYYAKTC